MKVASVVCLDTKSSSSLVRGRGVLVIFRPGMGMNYFLFFFSHFTCIVAI